MMFKALVPLALLSVAAAAGVNEERDPGVIDSLTSGAAGAWNTATSGAAGAWNTATSGAVSVWNTATAGAAGAASTVASGVKSDAVAFMAPAGVLVAGAAGVAFGVGAVLF